MAWHGYRAGAFNGLSFFIGFPAFNCRFFALTFVLVISFLLR
jgi:hypothetical protein